jgi:hypothetical protein
VKKLIFFVWRRKWVSLIPVEAKQVVFIIRISVVQPPQYLKLLNEEILADV